ncbi:Protein of unknown function [Actinacidiphila rubida]|uniref:DUF2786 domain-containing protein n=2 Tax=Actinacidiphila rubida TaxID=310780 RepID=A0A1H8DCT0_9ACTN|nr:DUF2786 domain-containing protein [Actinacidiphila rubida]SEN05083.1 Protein of unknown function [Actinacidiphila rubida]
MTGPTGFDTALAAAVGGGGREHDVDAAASVLAASGADGDAAAARAAARIVRESAARGWTVPDLVRMTGRELTPRHQRLAEAVLPEGRGPAAFAAAERLDRFSAAAAFVEVLCLCARLPRLPDLPRAQAVAAAGDRPASKMLGRIRALLAKAESTGFPEEAEALSAKAQQLMAAHSIDEALLGDAGGTGGYGPGARRIGVDRPYEGAKALLLDAVAAANRCEAVWASEFGFSTVVGHAADLDAVELLYTSLLVQADRALHRGRSRSRDYRESFLIAYAAEIRERLAAAAATEVAARPDEALLPALAARDLAVRRTRERLFPTTSTTRLKGRDSEGWQAGRTTARTADL